MFLMHLMPLTSMDVIYVSTRLNMEIWLRTWLTH